MVKKSTLAAALVGLSVMMAAGTIEAATKTHTATDNDTLWKLSRQYGVSLDALLEANPKIDPLNVYGGLKIAIPSAANQTAIGQTEAAKTVAAKSEPTVMAANGKEHAYKKALTVKATAYTAAASENGGWAGLDYFGNKLKVGTVAVDPKMIPLGTKLYVTGYDYSGLPQGGMIATATDVGGSIKGNRIDIYVPDSASKAMSFGIQNVKIYILK
ncbi:3D domain-containing protein [Paenibacillus arenilitoris]|uniref:LysM peptidoglycan-binding domain-containing protein n=1 Tax=Paenibacillus arenilitoris TaxID=2772299 RepID=A0A927CH90_9BACL|nr:3D domain-containing protein [Paenibacillus arenilitoris]MBD2868064.1 LysM peptidoglycan-binding domain-containing protein [Paenibacillus arenilitoris]